MKKISVIVPVYNTEKYLGRCIDSILAQTYKHLEIILVNDGSTDNSGEICNWYKERDQRVKVIHKINGGLSSARNAGLEIASGDYIAFVDSDDWLVEDIYEHCVNLMETVGCDVVDFQCVFVNNNSTNLTSDEKFKIQVVEGKQILYDYLYRGQVEKVPFTVWRKLYKRNLFENIRFPEGKINEDITTNYRVLMKASKLVHTNKVGYYYFQDSLSLSRNILTKKDFDLIDAAKELVYLTNNETNSDIKYLARVKLARSYFSLLAKIAFYGIDDKELDYKKVIRSLTRKLRQNYFLLMGSPVPINRKLMITAMCVNINLIKYPLSLYKKIRLLLG